MKHELKTHPDYFKKIKSGEKNFEIRKNDRDFKVGDTLVLREFTPINNPIAMALISLSGIYTTRRINKEITYILEGGKFGLEKGYVILSLK